VLPIKAIFFSSTIHLAPQFHPTITMPAASRRRGRHEQFNFLGLPRELRDKIYDLTLPATLDLNFGRPRFKTKHETPPKKTSSIWESDVESDSDKLDSTALTSRRSNRLKQYPLLLVSKQVNFEYSESIVRRGKLKFHISNWKCRQLGEWIVSRAILQSIHTLNLAVTFRPIRRGGRKLHSHILNTKDNLERNLRLFIAGMANLRRIVFEVDRVGPSNNRRFANGIQTVHKILLASIGTRHLIKLDVLYVGEYHWVTEDIARRHIEEADDGSNDF
jgi:hypothetical protein